MRDEIKQLEDEISHAQTGLVAVVDAVQTAVGSRSGGVMAVRVVNHGAEGLVACMRVSGGRQHFFKAMCLPQSVHDRWLRGDDESPRPGKQGSCTSSEPLPCLGTQQ